MPGRRVIFTGQSGIGKADLIRQLAALSTKRGRRVQTFHVGELMYERAGLKPGRILNLQLDKLESIRNEVFRDILDAASRQADTDIFVDTHATFRWKDGLFTGFAVDEIRKLDAHLCITVVADVDHVKLGLETSDFPLKLSLRDIMVWREEEMLGSELMATLSERCSRYIVPRQMTVNALFRLVFDEGARKIYLSYPISSKQPKLVRDAIARFRQRFHSLQTAVIFDPLDVTAEPKLISTVQKLHKRNPRARTISVRTLGRPLLLGAREVQDIAEYVPGQARAFDYRLIEQSDAIVALVPEHQRRPFRADGIIFEMAYAGYKGKECYLIWPAEEDPSLMFDLQRQFRSISEARRFFK